MKHLPSSQTFDSTRKNFLITHCPVCDYYTNTTQSYGNFSACPTCGKFADLVAVAVMRTPYSKTIGSDISVQTLYPIIHPTDLIAGRMLITLSTCPVTDFPNPFEFES